MRRVLSSEHRAPQVLMVTNMWPHDGHSGYGIFVARQVESVKSLGIECDVEFVEGYRSRWSYLQGAIRMALLNFSSRRPLVVHAHGGETALVARWFIRGPVVASYCGDDLLGTPLANGNLTRSSRVRRAILRHHARLMTRTITKSMEMEQALPPRAQRKNTVLPNGVDRDVFRPQSREEARRKLGWPADDRVALFAANPAVERKRHWLAESACKLAEDDVGPIRLEVAWGIPPDEMPLLMAAADCLLLTSAIEGSPNVVKEALCCNLPVVSTNVGDVTELLANVEPSWVCCAEPEELAEALGACLGSPDRNNGWERSAWLDQERIAQRVAYLYAELAPGFERTEF